MLQIPSEQVAMNQGNNQLINFSSEWEKPAEFQFGYKAKIKKGKKNSMFRVSYYKDTLKVLNCPKAGNRISFVEGHKQDL